MLLLAMVATIDGLPTAGERALATILLVASLAHAWAPSFFSWRLDDHQWPRHAAQLERKFSTGSRAPLVIPINTEIFNLRFDQGEPRYPHEVRADAVVASLDASRTVRQAFRCDCGGLNEVEVAVAVSRASSAGAALLLLLGDAETGRPATGLVVPGEQLVGRSWQSLGFEPIERSKDRRFWLELRVIGNDPGSPVTVLGSAGGAHAEREAWLDGKLAEFDVALRYRCRPETPDVSPFHAPESLDHASALDALRTRRVFR
jgi:hypothetical protein